MADQSDVENALVAQIAAALYPNGPAAPPCRIYRGWPNGAALDADLAAGVVNVTVFPIPGTARNTTRFPDEWTVLDAPAPTLTVSVYNATASFGGSAAVGQIAGLMLDGQSFAWLTQAGDTPATVAANLATQARAAGWIVWLAGAVLTVPAAARFDARVVANAPALREIRRQTQDFRITCWCASPAARDAAAAAIDLAIAPLRFLALADGSSGRIIFTGTTTTDQAETAALFRRDLLYRVEYPTTLAATDPAMLFGIGSVASPTGPIANLLG